MSKSIRDLAALISEFPGIGPRQARRIVQFLLSKNPAYREKVAKMIVETGARSAQCVSCFRYDDIAKGGLCRICSDPERDQASLMVVEKDADIDSMEAAGVYRGRYFVLGGLIHMVEKKNAPKARVNELTERIAKNGITEVILALSTTPEGDYTAREITQMHTNVKTSLLGRGLSIGAEIEYADSETLRNALKNRA